MKKYLIVICILSLGLSQAFAAGDTDGSGLIGFFQNILQIVSILQTIWMLPAALAGALMSNDIATGSVFGMTASLNGLRRISSNLSFLILGFLFVAGIFQVLFKKDKPLASVKKLIGQIAISSVLISASWFIIMVLLDISSILTFTASSFFSSVGGNQPASIPNFCSIDEGNNTCGVLTQTGAQQINEKLKNAGIPLFEIKPENDKLANFFPNPSLMSGPLIYLGKGVLQVDKFNFSPEDPSLKSLSTSILTQLLIFLMFIVPVLLLVITNFIRVFWIWIWLALAPFIVLINVFGWKKIDIKGFQFNNILTLIFQPVIVVTALSFALLFLYSMNSILNGTNPKVSDSQLAENLGLKIYTPGAYGGENFTVVVPVGGETGTKQLWDGMKNGIGYFIVSLFGVALIWSLLKTATATSQITKGLSDGMTGFVEGFAKTLPIVPIAGGVGITSVQRGLSGQTIGANTFQERNVDMQKRLESAFGIDKNNNDVSPAEIIDITTKVQATSSSDNYSKINTGFGGINKLLENKGDIRLQTSTRLNNYVASLLNYLPSADKMALGFSPENQNNNRTFDQYKSDEAALKLITYLLNGGTLNQSIIQNLKANEFAQISAPRDILTKDIGKK